MLSDKDYQALSGQLKLLGFKTYDEFLHSDLWVVFSRFVKRRKGFSKCSACCTTRNLNLHHVSYRSILDIRTLETLCRECHHEEHFGRKMAHVVSPQGDVVAIPINLPGRQPRKSRRPDLAGIRGQLVKKHGLFAGNRIFAEKYPEAIK